MPPSPNDLIQTLVDSGILSKDDASQFAPSDSGSGENARREPMESSSDALERLKQLGRLSDFQIEVLEQDGPGGILLGDYILTDRLGVGGMGEVFLAVHRVMRRQVAIKRLKTGSVNVPGLADRFMREVNARKLLFHLRRRIHWGAGLRRGKGGCRSGEKLSLNF